MNNMNYTINNYAQCEWNLIPFILADYFQFNLFNTQRMDFEPFDQSRLVQV